MALIEIDNLTLDLAGESGPRRVLDGLSFAIQAGESVGLVGESGSGKTMTALAIMGLLPAAARLRGAIRLDGSELLGLSDAAMSQLRGRRLAMIFQEPMTALNPVRTIGEQVAEGPRWHLDLSGREARDRAAELLERVGLPKSRFPLGLYPHELSGGQRQRVMIAMALASSPDLLIADEPTTALDVTTQARVLDLIVDLIEETRTALLLITHDMGVIAEMTDRMLVIYSGTIVEQGPTAGVFATMGHPYTQTLFHALAGRVADDPAARRPAAGGGVPEWRREVGCVYASRCLRVKPRCQASAPPAIEVSPGHDAWCFFPGPK